MYNEEQKRRFMSDTIFNEYSLKNAEAVFNAIAPFEEQWGADICTREAGEIQPVLDHLAGLRARAATTRIAVIKKYMKWCRMQYIPDAKPSYKDFKAPSANKMREITVPNPVKLQEYLDALFTPEKEQNVENIYRCYYWLAYAGVMESDVLKVKCEDVHLDSMKVKYDGSEFEIYSEGLAAFDIAANETAFIYEHPLYTDDKRSLKRDRFHSNDLLRGFRGPPNARTFRVEISSRQADAIKEGRTDLKLSYYRVWLSGVFFRQRQREIMGYTPNFAHEANEITRGREYSQLTTEEKQKRLETEFLKDYERWKSAWEI